MCSHLKLSGSPGIFLSLIIPIQEKQAAGQLPQLGVRFSKKGFSSAGKEYHVKV